MLDLLEKLKICVVKKVETDDQCNQLIADIESAAQDSKVALIELRSIFEDKHGVLVREALYDQLCQFFDLDRDQQVYITSLCEYLKNPSSNKINYFKVNKSIIQSQITAYIRNSIESTPDCLLKLEEEFKQEIWKITKVALLKKKQPSSDDESPRGDDES